MTFIINNKDTKLGDILKKHLKDSTHLALLLKELSLHGFAEVESLVANIQTQLLLATNQVPLAKRLACAAGEETQANKMQQKEQAKSFFKWLQQAVTAKGIPHTRVAQNIMNIDGKNPIAIQGSSDLTAAGLGAVYSDIIHLNTAMQAEPLRAQLKLMFDQHWQQTNAQPDLHTELCKAAAFLAQDQPAELIYFIILQRIFHDLLNELDEDKIIKQGTGFKNSQIWQKLYPFQRDGVLGVIDKLERYNGCILADSVGLGKTFEALAVIHYYERRNDRVLVLAPKKLRENWTLYTLNDKRNILVDDRFGYTVLNHTDLTRESGISGDINLETLNWGAYDLVVIDESHNFRNASVAGEKHTRYSKLMEDIIKSGVRTKVLMLSATPVNNRLNDLKNQIAFVTEGNDYALEEHGIANISNTLKQAQTRFNQWLKRPEETRTTEQLLSSLNIDYFKILDLLTIARSRKHIEKYYSLKDIGEFPTRLTPINIKADFDLAGEFPSLKAINNIIERLNLSTYSPLKYVRHDKRKLYTQKYDTQLKDGQSVFSQLDREKSLIGLMKVNLLKRLESSIYSFYLTTQRLLASVDKCIEQLEKHAEYEIDGLNILEADIDSPELEDLLVGNKVKVLIQDMDKARWLYDLQEDRRYLLQLTNAAQNITVERDEKLERLKQQINEKIHNPLNPNNKKVVVFTAFADTAQYLYQHLAQWALEEHGIYSGLVVGGSGGNKTNQPLVRAEFNSLLTAFSPISKELSKTNLNEDATIDLLFATDCISEGQNLQDCDYLINYDIHWNPVRIIQRFGRVDRLGSTNTQIQLVNFWPNIELDEYINLEARVSGRMVLLDVSATGEENLIDTTDEGRMRDLHYRKKQLKELQDNVLDLEDISGGLSITDLTLNDFKMDLSHYMQHNEQLLEQAPNGLYSVVQLDEQLKESGIEPGVIFCLKNLADTDEGLEEPYALFPYYLVHVSNNNTVCLSHTQVKKILDVLKRHSLGQSHANSELFRELGSASRYTAFLNTAIEHLQGAEKEQGINSIFSRGGTQLSLTQGQGELALVAALFLVE